MKLVANVVKEMLPVVANSISWSKMGFFTGLQLGTKSNKILEIMDGVIWVGFRKTMKLTQSNMG